jgi:hypothetical protein
VTYETAQARPIVAHVWYVQYVDEWNECIVGDCVFTDEATAAAYMRARAERDPYEAKYMAVVRLDVIRPA